MAYNRPGVFESLIGRRFGRWIVVAHDSTVGGHTRWLCRCDCGTERVVTRSPLLRGESLSCGCRPRVDITGQRFGRLVVERLARRAGGGLSIWRCRCDCGGEVEVRLNNLKTGNTKSCGCLHLDRVAETNATHGMSDTREYALWVQLWQQCTNPSNPGYTAYGARGIKVCERWRRFENFYADMGPAPTARHRLRRIGEAGDFEPGNCRWIIPGSGESRAVPPNAGVGEVTARSRV